MKKLIYLALASTYLVTLAGCGNSDEVVIDQSLMGDGTSSKTGLGGYWWTYVDRSGTSSVLPNTGKADPTSATSTTLLPGISKGHGIDDAGGGNLAYHVTGTVGAEPAYAETIGANASKYWDTYWDDLFPTLCGTDGCKEIKYPAAGLGFGFHVGNTVLGNDGLGSDGLPMMGVTFKLMLGTGQGLNATGALAPVSVSMPMDTTDAPDASFNDKFGTQYDTTLAAAAVPPLATSPNGPFCTFPGTLINGAEVTGAKKSCFSNLKVELPTVAPAAPVQGAFTTYCIAFASFAVPSWGGLNTAANPVGPIATLSPQRIIKMQFDAYQPKGTALATNFDFWVDDVQLLDNAKWAEVCAGAGVNVL